jgi:hypothetical protein
MGVHENDRKHKGMRSGHGLRVSYRNDLLELTFAPHFKSWPKLVRRLEIHGFSCEVMLVGNTISVATAADLNLIKTSVANHRQKNSPQKRLFLVLPVLAVAGALAFTLQPQNYSTSSTAELIPSYECGVEYLTEAIVSESPNPNILGRTSSRLGGIETGTFACEDKSFSYTLELTEPKRVISVLELDP